MKNTINIHHVEALKIQSPNSLVLSPVASILLLDSLHTAITLISARLKEHQKKYLSTVAEK